MNFLNWSKSIQRQFDHQKALLDQYNIWVKSNGKIKPKLIVGKKYRTRYPELYRATNPKADKWNAADHHLRSQEFIKDKKEKIDS